jgi:steroid 5-alpha reductase family enzyme
MRTRAFALCALAYAVALAAATVAAGFCAAALGVEHPIGIVLLADLVATVVIFGFSFAYDNSSFYDAYWSVAVVPIALYFALVPGGADVPVARQLIVVALASTWAVRLTWNWARGWKGLEHEDWRYVDKRRQTGRFYWPVSFLGLHLMPTFMVFGGCLALYPALSTGVAPLGWLDLVAAIVTAGAIAIEATADQQLRRFRLGNPPPEAILETGLWARCRHPNYLGEILFWWGLFLFALAADPSTWWTGVGALAITLLFLTVSLPMIETRMRERRPGYAKRVETTPLLLPRF